MTYNEFFLRFVANSLPIVANETIEFFSKLGSIQLDKIKEIYRCYYKEISEIVKTRLDRQGLFRELTFDDWVEYENQYKFEYMTKDMEAIEAAVKYITEQIPEWEHTRLILQETLSDSVLYYALLEYYIIRDKVDYSPIFLKFLGKDFM